MMATKEHRKPSYPAALRMARLAFELPSHPFGWTLDAIQRDLDISKRTLKRYLAASKDGLLPWHRLPACDLARRKQMLGDRPCHFGAIAS